MFEMEEQQIEDDNNRRTVRRRKKQLYQNILKQMEFYFGDANLRKDRFLAQLIKEDPYVDLNIFLSFGKIRSLTQNVKDLVKSLRMSEILTLSEDNTKVKRVSNVSIKENEDECTIYVERLPSDTKHEWLTEIFSKFGNVDYVSIPRYKHNKMIKGFAFIEYDKPESASKALEYFEFIGCKLPMQMPPDQLASIATFEHENMSKIDGFISSDTQNEYNGKLETKNSTDEQKELDTEREKRRLSDPDELNIKKKLRIEEVTNQQITQTNEDDLKPVQVIIEPKETDERDSKEENETEVGIKEEIPKQEKAPNNSQSSDSADETKNENVDNDAEIIDNDAENIDTSKAKEDDEKDNESNENTDETAPKRKKNRKKSKRKKNRIDLKQIGLKVLSKKEWKQLRNKYLNLQRQKMKSLKEQLFKNRFSNNAQYTETTKSEKTEQKSEPRFKYTTGCIIQFLLPEITTDIKKLKAELKTQSGVEYIDIVPNSEVGHIRFSSKENCEKFLESPYNWSMRILEGEQESDYWDKILQTREEKLLKSKKKHRGREKLLKKAEKELGKHIRFETE